MTGPALVVVDMQRIFAAGPWGAPRFAEALAGVQKLTTAFGRERATFTRFVAPADPAGAWQDYYRQWPFARQAPDAPDYELVAPFAGAATTDATTFGKWPAVRDTIGARPGDQIVVCGVSTDCCVLSTVLAAADDGMRVLVVGDACAGVDDESHRKALDVMALYAPLVRVVGTDEVVRDVRQNGASDDRLAAGSTPRWS